MPPARSRVNGLAAYAVKPYGGDVADVRFAADTVFVNGHEEPFDPGPESLSRVQLWSDGFYATPGAELGPEDDERPPVLVLRLPLAPPN
jgi:xanthine dehydrogenase large subunit